MQCPNCNQRPISPIKFVLRFNNTKIKCQYCDAKLEGNKVLKGFLYGAIIFSLGLGFSLGVLEDIYNWGLLKSVIFFIGAMLIVSPLELVAWKYGSYKTGNPPKDSQ